MHLNKTERRRALARAAWITGAVFGLVWFAGGLALAIGQGLRTGSVIAASVGGLLAGRVAALVVRRFLEDALEPIQVHVSILDRDRFSRRVTRALRWHGYRLIHTNRQGASYGLGGRTPPVLIPVVLHWQGAGVDVQGPRRLVRLVLRHAV